MIQVYFDNILINDDYYTGLSNNFNLFNEVFKLGSTASNSYTLSIAKEAVTEQPDKITLKEDTTTIAILEVDNVTEDDYTYTYILTDKMIDLEFYYDASIIFTEGYATLLSIVQDICNKAGIELATTDFRGYDKQISWYDNRRTAREYIGFVAELNGGYAQIGKDGKLYFIKQNLGSVKTINIDECADFEIGEKHNITRVVYELGTVKYEYGDETGNTLYLNPDNVFITEKSEVESIYNELKGFEFCSFKTSNCPVDFNIMAGQIITFTDGTNNYPTIASYELEYFGGWNGGYILEVSTKKQEETKVVGNSEKIKNLNIAVDRNANSITSLVEQQTETNEKLAEQQITVDGIQSAVSQTQTIVGNNYNELKTKFDDYAPKSDVVSLQTSVEKIQTDTYTKTEINTKLTDGSVTKVLTTAGTFDENGLTIEKTDAKTKGNFNEKGITVTDATSGSDEELLFAGYDEDLGETIVRSKNMTVEKYFVISNIARQEKYTNPVLGGKGIGVFIL